MLGSIRVLALALATLVLYGSAAAEWTSVSSEHFSVDGDAPTTQLRQIAKRLELSRVVLSRTLPWLALDGGHPLRVIVFADAAEYRNFKPKRADGTPDDPVAGYYLHGDTRDQITLAADGSDAATVTHEYVHYVLRSNLAAGAKLPPWLDEGLAQYFQSFTSSDAGKIIVGGEPLNRLAALRRGGSTVPGELFADDPSLLKGTDEQRQLFYSWAWAAVHFVLSRTDAIADLRSIISKAPAATASPDTAAVPELQEYVTAGEIRVRTLDAAQTVVKEPSSTGISAARGDTLLGDLLIKLGRPSEAETYLRRAIRLDRGEADAHSLLGIILATRGNWEEARRELEFATAHGGRDAEMEFFRAYAITRGGSHITDLDDATLASIRACLEDSVAAAPELADAAQLLALVYLSTDGKLSQASDLLKRAVALKPADESLQLLLARALLRQEKVQDSAAITKKLIASPNPQVRSDAKELADAAAEYANTRPMMVLQSAGSMPWDQPYIFLKRSWLAPDDLTRSEEQLRNHNANVMLPPLHASEQRVLGRITAVTCSNGINYTALVNGKNMTFSSASFDGVRLDVLIEGSRSFKLDCGADLSQTPAVLTYVPAKDAASKAKLTGISFVGDTFKLQTAAELWGYRTVVVDNDRLRKGPGDQIIYAGDLKDTERWTAISKDLRKPAASEVRVLASITKVACGQGTFSLTVASGNGVLNLSSREPTRVMVKWFTTENADASLPCGAAVSIPNVLLTYVPAGSDEGELKAIEFVPAGFSLPGPTEPSH